MEKCPFRKKSNTETDKFFAFAERLVSLVSEMVDSVVKTEEDPMENDFGILGNLSLFLNETKKCVQRTLFIFDKAES